MKTGIVSDKALSTVSDWTASVLANVNGRWNVPRLNDITVVAHIKR